MLSDKFDGLVGEPCFLLEEESLNLVQGARTTSVIKLSSFVDLFGDLVQRDDFSMESYRKRNTERELCIPEVVFDRWKTAGCLTD